MTRAGGTTLPLSALLLSGCLTTWGPPPAPEPCRGRCTEPSPSSTPPAPPAPTPWEEDGGTSEPGDADPPEPTDAGPTEPTDGGLPEPLPPDEPFPEARTVACEAPFEAPPGGDPASGIEQTLRGRWRGVGVRPDGWTGPAAYPVEFVFFGDGTYASRCLGEDCVALYYGRDGARGGRAYRVLRGSDEGQHEVELWVRFDEGSAVPGQARRVQFSGDGNRLGFEFYPTWLGRLGPLRFSLERQCEAGER